MDNPTRPTQTDEITTTNQPTELNPKNEEELAQRPNARENNESGLGGNFDKQANQGHGAAPGTSTADAQEEQDSDNPG